MCDSKVDAESPAAESAADVWADTEAEIRAALAEGALSNYAGSTAGLYPLGVLRAGPALPYPRPIGQGFPVAASPCRLVPRLPADCAEYAARVGRAAPALIHVVRQYPGIGRVVLAGGAAAAHLLHPNATQAPGWYEYTDHDLFMVGVSPARVPELVKAVGGLLSENCPPGSWLVAYRSARCVTFKTFPDGCRIQIALRCYATVGELLHGADNGACQVAWDGAELYVSRLGKLAAERLLIVANPPRLGGGSIERLLKYHARGYGLAFPELNVARLADFQKVTLTLHAGQGLRVGARPAADADDSYDAPFSYGAPEAVTQENLLKLLRYVKDSKCRPAYLAASPYKAGMDVCGLQPRVARDMALSALNARKELGELFDADLARRAAGAAWGGEIPPVLYHDLKAPCAALEARLRFPFRVESGSKPSSYSRRERETWYGRAYSSRLEDIEALVRATAVRPGRRPVGAVSPDGPRPADFYTIPDRPRPAPPRLPPPP